jgi:hypothetical protein
VPRHHIVNDAGGAGIIGLMHHRVFAMENPVIRVRSFNPDAGLVAGDKDCRNMLRVGAASSRKKAL